MTSMPALPRSGQHLPAWRDRRLQPRHVVAERRAEAAGLQEVALHVDDDERLAEIDCQRDGSASMVAICN